MDKQRSHLLKYLESRKETSDKQWERVFKEALDGKIDKELLNLSMLLCNQCGQRPHV